LYWRAALRNEGLRAASVAAYDGWRELVRDAAKACVDAGLIAEPNDLDEIAQGACALGDGLGIQIALGHPTMTWTRASMITRGWLAAKLSCPALAE
jgi:hypothetical protein